MHVLEDCEEMKCFWNDHITSDLWNKLPVLTFTFFGVAVTLLEFDNFG
jgi:hypothetical protein